MQNNGSRIVGMLRLVFGIFMLCVYLGMAYLLASNFFEWSTAPTWQLMRWALVVILALYGVYRGYRLIKGSDFYRGGHARE